MRRLGVLLVSCLFGGLLYASDSPQNITMPYGNIAGYEAEFVVFEDAVLSIRVHNVKEADKDLVFQGLTNESEKLSEYRRIVKLGDTPYYLFWFYGDLAWRVSRVDIKDYYYIKLETKGPVDITIDECIIKINAPDSVDEEEVNILPLKTL